MLNKRTAIPQVKNKKKLKKKMKKCRTTPYFRWLFLTRKFWFITDAPAEAVKRKVNDVADETPAADIADSIPEKKAKIAAEKETNGELGKEEVAA